MLFTVIPIFSNMPDETKLSTSMVDYIESIDLLTRQHGHAHTKDIAEMLHVKMPSVTIALRQLSAKGMIFYSANRPVELTAEGQKIADRIAKHHHTLESFFQRALGLSPDSAHLVSNSIDHIVDDDVVRRFLVFSRAIEDRTDCKRLATHLTEAMEFLNDDPQNTYAVPTTLEEGTECIYVRPSRLLSPQELERVSALGIAPGDTFVVCGLTLDRATLAILTGNPRKRVVLPVEIAENLWTRLSKEACDVQ